MCDDELSTERGTPFGLFRFVSFRFCFLLLLLLVGMSILVPFFSGALYVENDTTTNYSILL